MRMIDEQTRYFIFQKRLDWGIAQFQREADGTFGVEQWLAISDLSPHDPERRSSRVRVPDSFIESLKPVEWRTPAHLLSDSSTVVQYSKEHFWRLAAYWLQAENRQGQLDSLPVLQLRHQTSLVEYLCSPSAPKEVLIADEVGLGKTIELGLLITRLRNANPRLRILYVTPGGLVPNVVDEFNNLGHSQIWVYANSSLDKQKYVPARLGREEHDPWVVASLHRLGHKSNADKELENTEWDIVIADECHRLRMYGSEDNQNAQAWFRVVEKIISTRLSEDGRVYFLSGTPHQGNREVFLNLMAMMCKLGRHASISEMEEAMSGRVIYRTKEEIRDWEDRPLFPRRDIKKPCYVEIHPEYNELLTDISDFFDWLLENAENTGQRALGFVKSQALQYAASSPKAGF